MYKRQELNTTAEVNSRVASSASSTSGVLFSEVQALNDISVSIENSITGKHSLPRAVVVEAAPLRKRAMKSGSKVSDGKKFSYTNSSSPSILDFAQLTRKIVRLAKQTPRKKIANGETKSSRKNK